MYVLGISCFYHDASAALLKDGIIVAAAEEERFTRKKHDVSFPINAIDFCLKSQNITINDVDFVGFYEKPFLKFERLLSQHLEMFPYSFKTFVSSIPAWINEKLRLPKIIKKKLGYKKGVYFIEHHLAHAASSFLVSPFDKAAILTIDGVGEWTTTTYGYGEGNNITLNKEIKFPHSLGLLYSTITAYLGMSVNNSEYKCVHPDTCVLFSNGNLKRIEDLFSLQGKKIRISNDEEILKLKSKIELISLDKNSLKLVHSKSNTIYRKRGNTELYEVELLSGRKVIVTPNHKFTSVSLFGDIFSIDAKNIKKDNFVIIPRAISLKRNNISQKCTLWAKLLAYSIAEGHELIRKEKHEAEIRIGITDKNMLENIKNTATHLDKSFRLWKDKKRNNMYYIGISVWKDLDFLKTLGYNFGKKAGEKSIPEFVMRADKNTKKILLSALFDCDGSFVSHQIIYSSKSSKLINQITYLLLHFGIHSRIRKILNRKYNAYYYRIEINGKDLKTFEKSLGFNLKIKSEKLKKYLLNYCGLKSAGFCVGEVC